MTAHKGIVQDGSPQSENCHHLLTLGVIRPLLGTYLCVLVVVDASVSAPVQRANQHSEQDPPVRQS